MTEPPNGARIAGPMGDEARLSIRLDPGSGPISGALLTEAERYEFRGWIQLAGLLESLRPSAADRPGRDRSDPGSGLSSTPSDPRGPLGAPPAS